MNNTPFFDTLDPEVLDRVRMNRREALAKAGKAGLGAAVLTSLPVAFGLSARQAFGQGTLPQGIRDVLNFALTLEYLEAEFYQRGLAAAALIPAADRPVFQIISAHETAHVNLLRSVLGSAAVAKPTFDFSAGNGSGTGPFATVFTSYATFKAVAQAFEDTGVRAYKGQAGNLISDDATLTVALQIHSVEARHAAQLRRMNGVPGWIQGASNAPLPAATAAIYAGEDNTTQGGVNLATALSGQSAQDITEAFDEPLTKEQVLAIVDPFIV
jgi:rubrerythrin